MLDAEAAALFEEQIAMFCNKTGIPRDEIILDNYITNSKGFISYSVFNKVLFVNHVYGDGEYFIGIAKKLCGVYGCNRLQGFASKHARGYQKKYGFSIVQQVMELKQCDF